MTPDKAREHLAWPEGKDHPKVRDGSGRTWFEVQAGESYPYWNRLPDAPYEDAVMYAVAQGALATIAGMREEWGVRWDDDPSYGPYDWGFPTRAAAEQWEKRHRHRGPERGRVVRRYVTEPEEA